MAGLGSVPGRGRGEQVWLLGNKHTAADKSIGWHDQLPNLGDPDALIVDMTTLTEDVIRKMGGKKLDRIRKYIEDKFLSGGGTIAVITAAEFSVPLHDPASGRSIGPPPGGASITPNARSNYSILPVALDTVPVADGHKILHDEDHNHKEYVDAVGHFEFYIAGYNRAIRSSLHARKFFFDHVDLQDITDNSGHYLGFKLGVAAVEDDKSFELAESAGYLVFLPPYTEPAADAIKMLLTFFGRGALRGEAPPPWAEKVSLARANQLQAEIAKLGEQRDQVQGRMDALARERDGVLGHGRLLYSKGAGLEAAVADAFRLLGLEAEQAGGADEEDCVLAMGAGGYARGVVEVKGADARTRQQDIVQCAKWVDVWYAREGKLPKGVFVPNQHRMKEYPKSEQERLRFEPNELEYARAKDVCIIPSCVLFEAVKKTLDGEAPDRTKMAEKIAGTKGVLESVF